MKMLRVFYKKCHCTHNDNYKRLTFLIVMQVMMAMVSGSGNGKGVGSNGGGDEDDVDGGKRMITRY